MKRSVLAALVLVVAVVAAFLLGGVHTTKVATAATPPASTDGVVVDGTGKTEGTPDVLRLSLGVSGSGSDVTSALAAVDRQVVRVRAQLREDGARGRDIQTSDVNIYPISTKTGRRFQVSEQLTAKLRDLKTAGRAITNAVAVGGSAMSLQGVSFSLEDNTKLLNAARDRAYADAKQKAERYAKLSGTSLGKVQLVTEAIKSPQVNFAQGLNSARFAAGAAADVPLYAGTSQVSVSVTARWALS